MLYHSRNKLLKPYAPELNNTAGRNMTVQIERRGSLLKSVEKGIINALPTKANKVSGAPKRKCSENSSKPPRG